MLRLLLIALLAFAAPRPASAIGFAVDNVGDASDAAPGDGLCVAGDGSCTLRAAIEEANAFAGADTITLQAAKYVLSIDELRITSDIAVSGPGAGGCIIRGKKQTRIFRIDAGANVVLSGMTIERGRAESGGGILNDGSLELTQVVVQRNLAQADAGLGGGIYNNGSLALTAVTLSANRATGPFGGLGGSLFNNGIAVLQGVTVGRSRATGCGGGIFNNLGSIDLTDTIIERNSVSSSGGGLFHQDGTMTLTNVVVRRNRAKAIGGGVFTYGTLQLTNVSISNNRSYTGGGLFSRVTPITDLVNVTVSLNRARGGGGIMNNGTVSLKNTIVAENTPRDCEGMPVTSNGHNLASDGSCALNQAGDLSANDPLLGPLLDDGSGTLTHALLPGSPAIDAGDDNGCPPMDQRGQLRPSDGNGDSTATCDIGAYERQP